MKTYTPQIEEEIDCLQTMQTMQTGNIPYTIIMPPPNITGKLHLGHILNNTIQDILIRRARKKGLNTTWIPGYDHASIATEAKIWKKLSIEGRHRRNTSKEEFLKECELWKEEYSFKIISQLKRAGFSANWDKIRYTMDEEHLKLLYSTYNKLKEGGFIYKAIKLLPYDTKAQTFISAAETYIENNITYSERTRTKIEFRETEQLFIKMKELCKPGIEKIKSGEIQMHPNIGGYANWFENIEDWCISRQLWWGQKIPDFEGTFDTWFSSWLWCAAPFKRNNLPSQIMISGQDIAFFWIGRMIMANDFLKLPNPFEHIYFTGIMRDSKGEKFSKQLGNSPDIDELMKEYGADSMRFSTIINHRPGTDSIWSKELIIQGRKFCNKLWNINILLNLFIPDNIASTLKQEKALQEAELSFTAKFNSFSILPPFDLQKDLTSIYNYIWQEFAGQLLESCKKENHSKQINKAILKRIKELWLKCLSYLEPFMPFISKYLTDAQAAE